MARGLELWDGNVWGKGKAYIILMQVDFMSHHKTLSRKIKHFSQNYFNFKKNSFCIVTLLVKVLSCLLLVQCALEFVIELTHVCDWKIHCIYSVRAQLMNVTVIELNRHWTDLICKMTGLLELLFSWIWICYYCFETICTV